MTPTDAEIIALASEKGLGWGIGLGGMDKFLRAYTDAVLAKWGTPPAGEPVAWLHPANSTCVTTDPTAYARGIPLYTAPPVREPLDAAGLAKRAQVGAIQTDHKDNVVLHRIEYRNKIEGRFERGWREAEKYHGIKGGSDAGS